MFSFSDWKSSQKTKQQYDQKTSSPGWKKSQSWVENRLKQKMPTWQENKKGEYWSKVVDAMSLSNLVKHQQYNARNGSKIINWEIKNMPDGKQTIIVL